VIIAIGAFLNAIGILFGGIFGLTLHKPISARMQLFFRNALGAFTIFFGLRLVWSGVNGTFGSCSKQIFIALIALVLGNLLGKILALQKVSNHLGRISANKIAAAQKNVLQKSADGFSACSILFCAAPLGIIGAVTDGLSGYFWLLAVKAGMDALATASFVKIFRWPCALSAFPVFIFFGAITFAIEFWARPFLYSHQLTDSVNTAAGFITLAISTVIFGTRKVELANYLPALVIAPLLMWLFK
jgi:uncharacterized protein